jgi:cytochrome P450
MICYCKSLHFSFAYASLDMWPLQSTLVVVWGEHLCSSVNFVDEMAQEQILQTDNLPKAKPAYETLKAIIGTTSLVSVDGEHWKKLRKMFNPAFAPSHIEAMIPAIVQESQVFIEKLSKVADTGKVIEMVQFTTVWTPHRLFLMQRI